MKSMFPRHGGMPTGPARQRGVVLWVALVVLIVMSLAGLATLRQMGTGVSIAGNLAFKESATSVADAGTEVARQWLGVQPVVNLEANAFASGYYATWGASVDPTTYDWSNAGSVPVPAPLVAGTGNAARYVVHRLCQNLGPVLNPLQRCSDHENPTGGSKAGLTYNPGAPPEPPNLQAYFRVTVQVLGPRNTVSYTQVVMR